MMIGDLLTGIGVFLCVGALLVVVLVLLVYRALTSSRRNAADRTMDASMTTPEGQATGQPVEEVHNAGSPGGFNEIPATGGIRRGAAVYDMPDDADRPVGPVSLERPGAEDDDNTPPSRPLEGL